MAESILKSQPDILCNGRIGVLQPRTKRADFDLTRLNDFQSPEQLIGKLERKGYGESCCYLVDGQWGYKPDGFFGIRYARRHAFNRKPHVPTKPAEIPF